MCELVGYFIPPATCLFLVLYVIEALNSKDSAYHAPLVIVAVPATLFVYVLLVKYGVPFARTTAPPIRVPVAVCRRRTYTPHALASHAQPLPLARAAPLSSDACSRPCLRWHPRRCASLAQAPVE